MSRLSKMQNSKVDQRLATKHIKLVGKVNNTMNKITEHYGKKSE